MTPLEESVAVLLGACAWPNYPSFEPHQGFANSARDLRAYLLGNGVDAANLLCLFDDPRQPGELLRAVREFLRARATQAVRNVLFYYVGHGAYLRGDYVLAPRCLDRDLVEPTALHVRHLAATLNDCAPAKRQILIIDACYAAGAPAEFIRQGPEDAARAVAEQIREHLPARDIEFGTTVFCAAGPRREARLPRDGTHTMFSGALLAALRKGHPRGRPLISLDTLALLVKTEIDEAFGTEGVRPEVHTPRQDQGDIRVLEFFPNPAAARAPAETALPEPAPSADVAADLAADAAEDRLRHDIEWVRRSREAGWYELLELRKEIDAAGDLRQTHRLQRIHGPERGEIAAIPYGFRAEPLFGTCFVVRVTDEQGDWTLEGAELPPPATKVVGSWQLNPPATADATHEGLTVVTQLVNSFAMTPADAELRGAGAVERTSIRASYPVRHLRLVVLFPRGYQPAAIRVLAHTTDDLDKPTAEWPVDAAETARVANGFYFDRDRGLALLSVERALPESHYVLSWRLPPPPAPPPMGEVVRAQAEVRRLLRLGPDQRARLEAALAEVRDAVSAEHLFWAGPGPAPAGLSLLAYDEAARVIRVVATTLAGPARDVTFPWGSGVAGWVMRRRHPTFVDTRDSHGAGIYRIVPGVPPERHLLCVPLPLPTHSPRRAEALANPAIPCLVAALGCMDGSGNLALLKQSAEPGAAPSDNLLGRVCTALAGRLLEIVARQSLS